MCEMVFGQVVIQRMYHAVHQVYPDPVLTQLTWFNSYPWQLASGYFGQCYGSFQA